MNHAKLYSRAISRKVEAEEVEEFNILQQKLDITARDEWLKMQVTQEFLTQLENDFASGLDISMNYASSGNDQAAARTLIKLKTIKQILQYAKGN